LDCNRFGEYFFNNQKALANAAIKAEAIPTMEAKAAGSGRTLVEVQREERYKYAKADIFAKGYDPRSQAPKTQNQHKWKTNKMALEMIMERQLNHVQPFSGGQGGSFCYV
jgi:hypothetical protein